MPDTRRCAVLLVLVVLTGGCLGGTTGLPSTGTTTVPSTPPTAQWAAFDGPHAYPDPPRDHSNESAKRVVEEYETAFVKNWLAETGVNDFDAWTGDAVVVNRSDGGVYVSVETEYWTQEVTQHGTEQSVLEGDGYATATYFVSTETIRRVSGDSIHA